MGAIDKLQQRPTFGSALVQQAMQEARTDKNAHAQLQQLVDQRPADFEDPALLDTCHQLLAELSKDTFQIVPNRQTAAPGKPEVLEARITKVVDKEQRVDITPPPPPPPAYFRDPLNVTGKATAGSKVEFYNASVPGRPALGSSIADANGHFAFELTDETKFKFGDQVGVRLSSATGQQGRALIVPTEPFLITNMATTYFTRVSGTPQDVRTDHTSRTEALAKNTDDRPPFFQTQLVTPKLDTPSEVEQPYLFSLLGGDDAVEPNATITVRLGNEVFQTKADDLGQFALKVSGVIPGQRVAIEVRDLNGNGIDIPARVPPIALPQPRLLQGMTPSADGVRVNVTGVVPPAGALIVRNTATGVVSELVADKHGKLDGVIRAAPHEAFEVAVRDVNGHVSEEAALLVSLPASSSSKAGVVSAHTLDAPMPDLVCALQNLSGPPVDVVVNGVSRPGGPFLPLPTLPKVPPFAALDVVKDGAVVQTLRADGAGKLEGMIRGVHVGDALTFRLSDAAGRMFAQEVVGFVVPDGKVTSTVTGQVPPRLRPLDATLVGSGTLALDPSWLAPAKILVGKAIPTDFVQRHAVVSSVGGALIAAPPPSFQAEHAGGILLDGGATLTVTQRPGSKWVSIDAPATTGTPTQPLAFGYDDITGALHNVTEQTLPQLKTALSTTLAVVSAAYAQGKEPGDVGYDRALGAAKTLLFMLDRFCVQNAAQPALVQAAQQVAVDVLGKKPWPLELVPRDVVGPARQQAIEAPTSQAVNLLQARTLALGAVGRTDPLRAANRPAVDVEALSAASTYDGKTLSIAGALVAPGDELVVKVGQTVHTAVADKAGKVSLAVEVGAGTTIEIAQRAAGEALDQRTLNPIARAVVVAQPVLGEGHVVGFGALVQRAPDARAVVSAVFGGAAVKGLPPAGQIVVVKDGVVTAHADIDANGVVSKLKGSAIKDGDVVDVRVLDAAGRPFAPMAAGVVVGPTATSTGHAQLDVDALSLAGVLEQVGSGNLALPRFPRREEGTGRLIPGEFHAELKPFYGPSSSLEASDHSYSTKAAFPPGLLPDLAKGPEKMRTSVGDSVRLTAVQWDDGTINLHAGFYVDNNRPDFRLRVGKNGDVIDAGTGKPLAVPEGLSTITTLLKTATAFVAVAQKLGTEPGDGAYDLAARTAKSVLVACDRLIAQHPTFRTEILAAVRAAMPATMPFDLAPAANAAATVQTPPTDRTPAQRLAFWNAVHHDDAIRTYRERQAMPLTRPTMPAEPRSNSGAFFGGQSGQSPFFAPRAASVAPTPSAGSSVPLYMRAMMRTR